jgi:radical SAM-linked protein
MIGLPTEEESDVREIPRVGGRARNIGKRVRKGLGADGAPGVTVSVSTHVPKPHTPFQWCAMDPPDAVRQKQRWLKEEARTAKVDLRTHDCDTSWLEAVFARGDRTLGPVLERAYRQGARFDSWEDQKRMDVWERAFAEEGIDPGRYLGTIPVTARLPWDHIDVGLEDGFLLREYRKAVKSRLSVPCGKVEGAFVHATNVEDAVADERKLVCYDCGIGCDLSAMRRQRLDYLHKLGAESPRPPAVRPTALGPKKPAGPDVARRGQAHRYRLVYEKLGAAAYLSHLDLIRALPRTFRRLGLPVCYSQGFHPKPEMTFGPALSLGVASLCEVVDVKIAGQVDVVPLLEQLTAASQPGLRFVGALELGPGAPSIARVLGAARYVVGVPVAATAARGGTGWLRERVASAKDRDLTVVRRIEGVGKRVDVRDYMRDVAVGGDDARWQLERAGLAGDLTPIDVDVDVRSSGGVKIAEVMEAFFRGDDLPFVPVRVALGARRPDGTVASPLEVGSAPLGDHLATGGGGIATEQA